MACNEKLVERLRRALADRKDISEKRMFGGVTFLNRGNMVAGVVGDDLMVRVGPAAYDSMLEQPHARPMDFTGKPMKGFVFVSPAGVRTAAGLKRWLDRGLDHAAALKDKS